MGRRTSCIIALVAATAVIGSACSKKDKDKPEYVAFGEYVNPQDSLPRVRYFETNLVSLNDRCAVRKVKLNTKMPPVYVNGRPVGFC